MVQVCACSYGGPSPVSLGVSGACQVKRKWCAAAVLGRQHVLLGSILPSKKYTSES